MPSRETTPPRCAVDVASFIGRHQPTLAPWRCVDPADLDASTQLVALVAARNVKRLAVLVTRDVDPDDQCLPPSFLEQLMALPDDVLRRFLTGPEVSSVLAYGDRVSTLEHAGTHLTAPWIAAIARAGGTSSTVGVPASRPGRLEVIDLGMGCDGLLGSELEFAVRVEAGAVFVEGVGDQPVWTLDRGVADLHRLPVAGSMVVSSPPNAWLRRALPGVEMLAQLLSRTALDLRTAELRGGLATITAVWPDAEEDIRSRVRWALPMAEDDSFFVPAFLGLITFDSGSAHRLARTIIHETSHTKLSAILQVSAFATNPDELCRHPFSREQGPVVSLLQSCWAFSHEGRLIERIRENGCEDGEANLIRVARKISQFLEQAMPLLRRVADATPVGAEMIEALEAASPTAGSWR